VLFRSDINVAARSSAKDTYIKPEKLGTNLYVICLTAKIEYGSDLDLSEGITYYYDLIFKNGDTFDRLKESTNNKYLTEDVGSILLDSKLLPSFLLPRNELPSDDSNHLKIFHASCRKPHGNSKDGLSNAFNVLNNSNVMGYVRPQMLFLTGDQIYADDVSDILLKIIRDAQYSLMGWHETLPNISGNYNLTDLNYDQSLDPILQGKRGEVIVNLANFTVDEKLAQSHLITLGDFFMMYVFC
jgi:hypothetical protein